MPPQTRVGVGVFVIKNGQFLMGRRLSSHGSGTWSNPGGHINFGESFAETAKREVWEETGVKIKRLRFGAVTNDLFKADNKHYVTIWMLSDWASGQPVEKEPDKLVELGWYSLDKLPSPLFLTWQNLLKSPFIVEIKRQLGASLA